MMSCRFKQVSRPSEAENRELIRRAQAGDRAAREEFLTRNTPLVIRIATGYRLTEHDTDDLIQEGLIQLDRAIDAFDLGRGIKVSTYACPKIIAGMGRWRHRQGVVRAPAYLRYDSETAREMKRLRPERYEMMQRRADCAMAPATPIQATDADVAPDERRELSESIAELEAAICGLDDRAQEVLRLRYRDRQTLGEVGAVMGVSKERVRQIERQSLARLRRMLTRETA